MNAPLLSTLREPPVVGRFYMVPVIRDYPYNGIRRTWPVIGPKHTDADFFNLAEEHYHVDARFIPNGIAERLTRSAWWSPGGGSLDGVVGSFPLPRVDQFSPRVGQNSPA